MLNDLNQGAAIGQSYNAEQCNQPRRLKTFEELTIEEKLEHLYRSIKALETRDKSMHQRVYALEDHRHDSSTGAPMVAIHTAQHLRSDCPF